MTSAITREMVAVALPLIVETKNMRRLLRTVMWPAVIRVAVTEKSKTNARTLMTDKIIRLVVLGSGLRCVAPSYLKRLTACNS